MAYRYKENVDPSNRFDELEFQRQDGSTAILQRGLSYDLTATEIQRVSQYIVLEPAASATAEPVGIQRLPIRGNPTDGQVPFWDSDEGAFVPTTLGSGGGALIPAISGLAAGDVIEYDGASWVNSNDLATVKAGIPYINPQGGSLSAAITTAYIVGGTVVIDRSYTLTATMSIPDNVGLSIRPGGALDFGSGATGLTCISATGTVGGTVAVNVVSEGDTAITGAAGIEAGIAANDWLRLSSDDRWDPLRTNSPIGEIVQVASTPTSGSIPLRSPARDTYTTTPLIAKMTMRTGVTIEGSGRIIAPAQGIAVKFDCAVDCAVSGSRLRFESAGGATAIQLLDAMSCTVEGFSAIGYNYANSGYGASFVSATRDCWVRDGRARDCRHATTTAAAAGRPGIPRDCWIESFGAWDITGDCFDAHAVGDGIHYRNCHSYDAAISGFNIECPHATVVGCSANRSAAHGILANNWSARPSDYTISLNVVRSPGSSGVRYTNGGTGGAGSSQRAVRITGNEIYGSGAESILVRSTDTWRTGRVTISSNTVSACQNATGAIHVLKGDGGSIASNVIEDIIPNGIGLRINDWTAATVTSNEFSFASLGTGLCIYVPANSGAVSACVIAKNTGRTGAKGVQLDANATSNTVTDNDFSGCTTPTVPGTGAGNVFRGNRGGAVATIASASTVTLPGSEGDLYKISGTATIDTITATGTSGRHPTLIFTSTAGLSDGVGNLRLSAAFTGTADDSVSLSGDGTNFFERARSAN